MFTLFDLLYIAVHVVCVAAATLTGWHYGGAAGALMGVMVGWLIGWIMRYVVGFLLAGFIALLLFLTGHKP